LYLIFYLKNNGDEIPWEMHCALMGVYRDGAWCEFSHQNEKRDARKGDATLYLQTAAQRFAHRINRARNWKSHLWQGRFFYHLWMKLSLSVGGGALCGAKSGRAGMVERDEDYRWSSAAAHCGNRSDGVLNPSQVVVAI
jgi:hypothetical protein